MEIKNLFADRQQSGSFVQLTLSTDYSLRILMYAACRLDRRVTMREIAEAYQISLEHLRKVIHRLAQNGFLATSQGRGGGFTLGRSPEQIHIGEVVALMEETMDIVDCQRQLCPLCGACSLKDALNAAKETFIGHLNTYTLADLLKDKRTSRMIKQLD